MLKLYFYSLAGEETTYAGVRMSSIIEQGLGVGDVISLLWFKRSLPRYCTRFIEVTFTFTLLSGHWTRTSLLSPAVGFPDLHNVVCRSWSLRLGCTQFHCNC